MSELNEGIRIKSWKEWRQGITNAKNRIGAFFSGNPQPTGEVTPDISDAQRRIDNARKNNTTTNTTTNTNTNNNTNNKVVNKNNSNSSSSDQNQLKKNQSDAKRLKNNPSKFFGTNQYGEGGSKNVSSEINKQNTEINKTQPVKTDDYLGKSQGLLGKDAWINKTRNSPAARSGAFTGDERWNTQLKHRQWQKDNNRGVFKVQKVNTPKIQTQEYEFDAYDLVLEHLTSTHQVESVKEAHHVMMEMDADIIKAIVDEAIERQAKDRKKLSQPHATPGNRREHDHDVDSAMTDYLPRKGKGRMRPASKKEIRTSAMRDAGKTNN